MDTVASGGTDPRTPLQVDLVEMVHALREAERDVFGMVPANWRESPEMIDAWSIKDVRAHMAAWRSIEARRLLAAAGEQPVDDDDPATTDPLDDSNMTLHAKYADWSWDEVNAGAETSFAALVEAIERSSTELLCECDDTFAGIGANGINHAMGHLPEVAKIAGPGAEDRFGAYAREVEGILGRGHLMPRDSGIILYNIACARAVSGDLDEARRLLRAAFARRGDLLESALVDSDLAVLSNEIAALAQS